MDEEAAGDVLAASPAIRRVRERLLDGATLSWSSWSQTVREVAGTDADPARFLMDSARARDRRAPPAAIAGGRDHILPVRLHLFQASVTGAWACIDPICPGRPPAVGAHVDRSDERRVGKERLWPCRSRWSQYSKKKQQ